MSPAQASTNGIADYLRSSERSLTAQWTQQVLADQRIVHSEQLNAEQLIDHIPVIFSEMSSALDDPSGLSADEPAIARTARLHGYYRWAQGYRPDELVLELDILRELTIDSIRTFCQDEQLRPDALLASIGVIEKLFSEVALNSLRRHVAAQDTQFEELLRESTLARTALEEADRMKNEFLAMLGHELRNPLAAIIAAAAVMQFLDEGLSPRAFRASAIVARQSKQLARLVDQLLDVGRIAADRIQIETEEIDLRYVLDEALEQTQPLLEARGHRLETHFPANAMLVKGDSSRLVQVFSNLLENAAKYTDQGGSIELSLSAADHLVIVKVKDNGIGIPREMMPHIFDIFTQAPRSPDRSSGGLGVGLTVVQRVTELHGGTVLAISAGIGQGSEFVVELPLASNEPVDKAAG